MPEILTLTSWELARFERGQLDLERDQTVMFASDGGIGARLLAFSAMLKAESRLYKAFVELLGRWSARVKGLIFGGAVPDVQAMAAATPWFAQSVDELVDVEIREIFDDASHDYVDEGGPDALARTTSYLAQARNRLVGIPDRVYANVRAEVTKATTQGWSIDELSQGIDKILADADAEIWKNRARTIARTEALGAYNAGRYAGFRSLAAQLGGSWEKVWLETHDHRTRPTHRAEEGGVGGARIPLGDVFKVGVGYGLYPGAVTLPPQEVINCRCSILLVREGETLDYSNRQYRRPK